MGKWSNLTDAVAAVIRANGNREITGQVLQNALLNIISNLGNFASFAGVATPSTNPGTPDGPVYYFATQAGTYTNFGSLALDGSCYVLYWNGTAWSSTKFDLPTTAEVTSAMNSLIATESTSRQQADASLQSAIAAEATRAAGKEQELESDVSNCESDIALLQGDVASIENGTFKEYGYSDATYSKSDVDVIPDTYISVDGTVISHEGWQCTDYIPIEGRDKITTNYLYGRVTNIFSVAVLFNSSKEAITIMSFENCGLENPDTGFVNRNVTIRVSDIIGATGAKYVRFNYFNVNYSIDFVVSTFQLVGEKTYDFSGMEEAIDNIPSLESRVSDIENGSIEREVEVKDETVFDVNSFTPNTAIRANGEEYGSSSCDCTGYISIGTATKIRLQCYYCKNNSAGMGALYDANHTFICALVCLNLGNQLDSSQSFDNTEKEYLITDIIQNAGVSGTPVYVRFNEWHTQSKRAMPTLISVTSETEVVSFVTSEELESSVTQLQNEIGSIAEGTTDYDRVLSIAELPIKTAYDMFVFAGQSNMMGASAKMPSSTEDCAYAFEYKYKKRLQGQAHGEYVNSRNPAGEWHYKNPSTAWGQQYLDVPTGKSTLANYSSNCYFIGACSNAKNDGTTGTNNFSEYSELTQTPAASLPPYFARAYASYGHPCIYAHIAKGSTRIEYYFDSAMQQEYESLISEYNSEHGTTYTGSFSGMPTNGAALTAFIEKVNAMTEDFSYFKPNCSINSKCFVWLQGESNASSTNGIDEVVEYKLKLQVLWNKLRTLGFTKFLMCRIGYFGNSAIINIQKAQEQFCEENENCHMITRAYSYMKYTANTPNNYIKDLGEDYLNCRDSFYGYSNYHFNEKGHRLAAQKAAENAHRVIHLGLPEIPEEENIVGI